MTIFWPQSAQTIIITIPNDSPGILPVFPVFPVLPAFLRFWENSAITTHTNSRAGGKDYGSFNKLPQTNLDNLEL